MSAPFVPLPGTPASSAAKRAGHQLVKAAVEVAIGGKILAPLQHPVLPTIVGHEPARFLDQKHAGRAVPRIEIVFPEAVHAPGRDPSEVEASGAEAADAGNFGCDGGVDTVPLRHVRPAEMRDAGPDQRLV